MRSLLLAVFASLAIVASGVSHNNPFPPRFYPGVKYVFRYEAQLVTGAEHSSNLWSGLRLTANVEFYIQNKSQSLEIVSRMANVNLQKFDKMVEDRTPAFFLQSEDRLLDGVEADVTDVMLRHLEGVFSFTWTRGHVDHIMFKYGEPIWSKNIKRGLMNMLEVNLEYLIPLRSSYNPNKPSYTVWEETTFGRCLTTYTPKPNHDEKAEGPSRFYLTKVRDYATCMKKPHMAFAFDNVMSEDNSTGTHLFVGGETSYAIHGNSDEFFILTAVGESKFYFYPYGNKEGSVQTSINQTMYYMKQEPAEVVPVLNTRRGLYYNITMELPIETVQNLEPYVLYPNTNSEAIPNMWSKEKMDQLLTWVANATQKYPSEESLLSQQQLIEMIHGSKPEVLRKILSELIDNEEETEIGPIKLKIYWQLLSNAGTTCASEVLLDRCNAVYENMDKAQYDRCISALTKIGQFSPPSREVINKMIDLIVKTMSEDYSDEKMKMVSVLTTGAVVGRAVDVFNDLVKFSKKQSDADLIDRMEEIKKEHDKLINGFLMVVEQLCNDTLTTDYHTILGLAALRNAHVPDMMIQIYKLQDKELKPSVRIAAAQAFEKLRTNKKQAVTILEMIVKNPMEGAALRIQAFRSMMSLNPPVHVLIRLAGSIRYEKTRQVSTYVWSTFNQLVNSTFKPYQLAADKIRSAMQYIQPVQYGLQDSHYRILGMDIHNDAGVFKELSYVSTSSPDFVTSMDAGLYVSMFGGNSKMTQVSTITEGLEHVIKKMMGSKGFFTRRNSIFDLLKRGKRSTDYKEEINRIFAAVNITARQIPKETGYISMQSMNNIIRLWDYTDFLEEIVVNKEVIVTPFDQQSLKDGIMFRRNMTGITHQYYMQLPSDAGFPIHLQMSTSYSANVKGMIHAEVRENIFKEVRENNPPTYLNAGIYVIPRVVTSLSGRMYVDGYIFQAGTLIKGQMDMQARFSLNVSVDLKEGRLQATFAPPLSTDMPLVKLDLQPYVYSRAIANDINDQQLKVNKRPFFYTMQPIYIGNGARMQQTSYSYAKNWLGLNVKVEHQHPWRAHPYTPWVPLNGRSFCAVYLTADMQAPSVLSADFRYFNPKKSDSGDVPLKDFPDLGAKIDFLSVKNKIQQQLGEDIPIHTPNSVSKLAFVLVLNSSRLSTNFDGQEELVKNRCAVLSGLLESWDCGRIYSNYLSFIRTPISGQEAEPWKMTVNITGRYPPNKQSISDLTDPLYQKALQEYLLNSMQLPQHRVVNKYFEELVLTKLSERRMRLLPSLNRDFALDSTVTEVVQHMSPSILKDNITDILKTLLPLTQQLTNLESELKDAFKLDKNEGLLEELMVEIHEAQEDVKRLLHAQEHIQKEKKLVSATAYALYKLSEAVFTFEKIALRTDLQNVTAEVIHKTQTRLYSIAKSVLYNSSLDSHVSKVLKYQLKAMHEMWESPKYDSKLIEMITKYTPNLVRWLDEKKENLQTYKYCVLQCAIQHQLLVKMMHVPRYGVIRNLSKLRYSLKVQTKQLLERFIHQERWSKLNQVCIPPNIPRDADDKNLQVTIPLLLESAEHQLLELQFKYVKLPEEYLPYTTDPRDLIVAKRNMSQILTSLVAIRGLLLNQRTLPPPCLTIEFADTVFALQHKVDIFRKMLTAQEKYPAELIEMYRVLEADVNEMVLSMSPVLDLYYTLALKQPLIDNDELSPAIERNLAIEDPQEILASFPGDVPGLSDNINKPAGPILSPKDSHRRIGTNIVLINVNITYGTQTQKDLLLEIRALKSSEQMVWESFQFYPTMRDVCMTQALQDGISGLNRTEWCSREIARRLNTFNHLHAFVDTEEEQLPSSLSYYMTWLMRLMRHKYYQRSDYGEPQSFIQPNSMQIILDLSPYMNSVDMYFMTVDETNMFRKVPLSPLVKPLYPFQNVASVPRMVMNDLSAQLLPATCKVDRGNLRTFDSAIFPFDFNDYSGKCTKSALLAMDCSEDKTFTVSVNCMEGLTQQTLQILTQEHEVVITPSPMTDSVLIDGIEKVLQYGVPIIYTKSDAYGQPLIALWIMRESSGFIRIEFPTVGLKVHIDGQYYDIQSSIVYKNQMCGICGNYDGQMTKELEGPKRRIYPAANTFIKTYLYPQDSTLVDESKNDKLPVNQPPINVG